MHHLPQPTKQNCHGITAAISVIFGIGAIISTVNPTHAQVIQDGTLPNNTNVTAVTDKAGDVTFSIDGGTSVGKNLFHSFTEFSLLKGQTAIFINPRQVENVFSRVTGGKASNIDGLIQSNSRINLFLINPNGIIFGSHASLNIGGSFIATTANSIKFDHDVEFSAKPTDSTSLLRVTTPLGLQYGANAGKIQAQGESVFNPLYFQVATNQTFALIGGNIVLENLNINTIDYGGNIELGSIASAGFVGLIPTDQGFTFNYSNIPEFGDIQILSGANISSLGDVQLTGKNILLQDGIVRGFNNFLVNATENIQLIGKSEITIPDLLGTSGNLIVNSRNLRLQDQSSVGVSGGNLTINASENVELKGNVNPRSLFASRIYATASEKRIDTGNLTINTRNLSVQDGSQIVANSSGNVQTFSLFSSGTRANLTINAAESVTLSGSLSDEIYPSGLFTKTYEDGNAGTLTINTGVLRIDKGAQVIVRNLSTGKSGNLNINATKKVQLIGTSSTGLISINAKEISNVDEPIFETSLTPQLLMLGIRRNNTLPSGLFTDTITLGDASSITINTREFLAQNGGRISADTFAQGRGGDLTINAVENVQLIGTSANGIASGLFTRANPKITGDAGNLAIFTGALLVQDGAQISTSTLGVGKGGNLSVQATQGIKLIGVSDHSLPSGLFAQTNREATGDAGDLTIDTTSLLVQDGAQVSASTFGVGKGGNLRVQATEGIKLIGVADENLASGLFTQTNREATGDAGDLTIDTSSLLVQDGAQVSASTFGVGQGGNLRVNAAEGIELIGTAPDALFPSGLFAVATTGSTGNAGNLFIDTQNLLVRDGAQVSVGTNGGGAGGNLTVKATERVQLIGTADNGAFPSGLFATATSSSTGAAGNLILSTDILQIEQGAGVAVRSRGQGSAGNLEINARQIRLDNQAFLNADTRDNRTNPNLSQANIYVRSPNLTLLNGSSITTNATGKNVIGGNIDIDTNTLIAVQNSDISANSANFQGGKVKINAQTIVGTRFRNALTPESDITATGATPELSGSVEITSPEVNPSQGLIQLPANVIDASTQIYQKCRSAGAIAQNQNQFIITGRGGIPTNPYETLDTDSVIANWVTINDANTVTQNAPNLPKMTNNSAHTIVEAQAWVVDHQGNVILTAQAPQVTPHSPALTNAVCAG
ncbi:filamentous hemagglutinin N-terminal domain-containing protein [Nostoc sp. TCL26-01]|uniref:two-partner secretion domain-containing protein n=1 Tax=Nostoc sp. TCL26-01 TaxID=2576904 RepID=UPI001C4B508E|nr:filamentous hemagglutinin N-terminal domain-containing protein [Nostoc sp. TCL26-01]QLE55479.1 filamentous hemagglutinin N-terminal domain-containing protein [Nostoc sp. TCL26-01]